jgi:dTDP-4-dehydrorhamnose 3,5-epimerase
MQVIDTPLADLKIVKLKLFGDARGFFVERFHAERFTETGLPSHFPQDNHSRSAPGILRGLQHSPAQGKLVGVVRGRIFDVAVDVRPTSPTFGQHFGLELSDENATLLWIPGGFAHGFCVLGEEQADVYYKCTATYDAAKEGGIMYNDPELGIAWPLSTPTISERDKGLVSFAEYRRNPMPL